MGNFAYGSGQRQCLLFWSFDTPGGCVGVSGAYAIGTVVRKKASRGKIGWQEQFYLFLYSLGRILKYALNAVANLL